MVSCKNMFYKRTNIIEIDFSNFDFSNVITMLGMFSDCSQLEKINFGSKLKINTSKVTSVSYMFSNCIKLKELNLGNFNTSSVTNFKGFLFHCENLEYIDLSSFETYSAISMHHMFFHCYSLKSITFPETFKTYNVNDMNAMFSFCRSVTSLNLSNFDTSKVAHLGYMFHHCEKLQYLDISHFSSANLKKIDCMFRYLSSIIYLNIYSLDINNDVSKDQIFDYTSRDIKICTNKANTKLLLSSLNFTIDCSDICFQKNSKLDIINKECTYSCREKGYLYAKNKICYQNCPDNTHQIYKNDNNDNNFKDDDDESICLKTKPEGYYLDNDGFYKKCYEKCQSCFGAGNEKDNNCTTCKDNYIFLNDSYYINNCYEKCQNYYYFNETNNYICTSSCFGTYDKTIPEKKKCIDHCENDTIYIYEYNKICYKKCPNGTFYSEEDRICLKENNLETTLLINDNINNDFNSIINTSINSPTTHIHENVKFSTSLNEIYVTTNNFLTEVLNQTIISTFTDKEITDAKTIPLSISVLKKSFISQENTILTNIGSYNFNTLNIDLLNQTTISQTEFQSQSNKYSSPIIPQSEYNYKTNFIINGNNEEIYQGLIDNVLKNYDISKGEELIFSGEDNFFFLVTNSKKEFEILNGKNNNTNRFSIINLGECENVLKKQYQLNENSSLLIIKYEKVINDSFERYVQYEVYGPYHKNKLNLSICDNITIEIYIPVVLTEKTKNLYEELKSFGYNLFDINDAFYQDICTPYKSQNGTDILLSDRVNYYYNNDETKCQSNCKFSDYIVESQYLKCDCDISNSEINIQNTKKFSAKSIYQSFYNVLKYSNYKVLKCSELTFTLNSITSNMGSILTIIYFIIYSIFLIIYILKGINKFKTDISVIVMEKADKINFNNNIDIKEKIINKEIIEYKKQIFHDGNILKYKGKIDNIKSIKNLKYRQNNKNKKQRETIFF